MDRVLRWYSREEKMKRLQVHALATALVAREVRLPLTMSQHCKTPGCNDEMHTPPDDEDVENRAQGAYPQETAQCMSLFRKLSHIPPLTMPVTATSNGNRRTYSLWDARSTLLRAAQFASAQGWMQ